MKLNRRIIAICAAIALLLAGVSALAEPTITVQGIGRVEVDADRAGVSLGVRVVSKEVQSAQSQVNDEIAAIVEALKAKGVDAKDISTNGIGIYPNYGYESYDENESITGYTAYNNIYVKLTDVNNVGAYIDAAFAAGANSLDYVEFSAADTDEAARQALTLAVESAREKAQILAEAAGMKLGDILEIQDTGDSIFDVTSAYIKSNDSGMGAGTDVHATRQSVGATVNITFSLIP